MCLCQCDNRRMRRYFSIITKLRVHGQAPPVFCHSYSEISLTGTNPNNNYSWTRYCVKG